MSAGPFLADRLATWFCPWCRQTLDSLPHRRQIFLWLIVAGVFWSGFAAWREEHRTRVDAENKLTALPAPKQPPAPPRDPDGLYQLGVQVGSVGPTRIDQANSVIDFNGVRSFGKLNANVEVEYRDFVLRCEGLPATPAGFSGSVSSVSTFAHCQIVRARN